MITDDKTNFVYLSDLLEEKYPTFYGELLDAFEKYSIDYDFLKGTKDIWAVDYMPVQVSKTEYVQFVYDPDYLKPTKWQHLRTCPQTLHDQLNIRLTMSSLVVDGGNIVKGDNIVIVTDKIFNENKNISKEEVLHKLKTELGIENVVVIPKEPGDIIGHSDGMIRFVNNETVLLNDFPEVGEYKRLKRNILSELEKQEIEFKLLPYRSYKNLNVMDAIGCYINYLELSNTVFVPVFDMQHDEAVINTIEGLFPQKSTLAVNSNELAKDGGVLNCITWNILKS